MGTTHRLTVVTKLGFAAGDFGFNLIWTGTSLFLFYFYTDVLGLSALSAGLIYFAGMAWDAVSDPLMAVVADRTRTAWGRYRPYILFGAAPLGLSYGLTFFTPDLTGAALLAWTLLTHCLLRTLYTVVSIPYSSLQARLTQDSNARAGLAGWRMMGAATGALSVALLTPTLVAALGDGDEQRGYFLAACILGALSCAICVFCFLAMREPEETAASAQRPAHPFLSDLRSFFESFFANGPLIRVFVAITVSSLALTMFGKNLLYYFKYVLEQPEKARLVLALPGFAILLTAPFWVLLAQRTSKRTAWMIGAAIAAAGYLAFYFNPAPSVGSVTLIAAVISIGTSAFAVMYWSMLPDTVEYGEAKTGVRHEAKAFGFASFAQKAALGLNAMLLGLLLGSVGFEANEVQSAGALNGITAMMSLIPLAGVAITVLALWGYPIDARRHALLRAQIDGAPAP